MEYRQGDRVRIKNPLSEYTGCRGTIMIDASDQPASVAALGHFVAVDGENGRTRPFLIADLEPLAMARVRPPEPTDRSGIAESGASVDGRAPRSSE